MRNVCLVLLFSVVVSGCNLDEAKAIMDNASDKKVWAFFQFNVPQKGEAEGYEDYYFYGKVSEPLYTRIKSNSINVGFILLDDAKYWGQDNIIYEYADGENEGEMVFRIEDIRTIELVNKKPIAGLGYEQFELNTKANASEPAVKKEK